MRVLITGAGGRVARGVRGELARKHTLRLMDVKPVSEADGETIVGSITDRKAIRRALEGMDAVVHMAMSRYPYDARGFDVSIKGTYMLLEEAAAAGIDRTVCTGTLSVYARPSFPERVGVTEDVPPVAGGGAYTVMKVLEEQIVRFFAVEKGLSTAILRLTGPTAADEWDRIAAEGKGRPANTHMDDVAQAYRLALEADSIGFEIFHIGPKDTTGYLPIDKAHRILGYSPRWAF